MVIYLHGNASARVEVLPQLSFLLASGIFGVCSIDFTGSGLSDGDYVSLGYFERYDLECILQHLQHTYKDSNLEIVLWGRSMGASTALMHASEQSREIMALKQQAQQQNKNPLDPTSPAQMPDPDSSNAILKGLICDSPFASLPQLCEELVEKARAQGIVVPGIVVSVAIAMIARSVSKLAHFSIREIAPVDHVSTIDTPALFVVGADDDFIPPHHSEDLCAAYNRGISTNLLMVPGGHNDARPMVVFDAIGQFLQFRLSLTGDMMLHVPDEMLNTYHTRPPWAYQAYGNSVFQIHSQKRSSPAVTFIPASDSTTASDDVIGADSIQEDFGMTQQRQDDIQDKLHLMLGQGGSSSSKPQATAPAPAPPAQQQKQQPTSNGRNEVVAMGVPMVATGVPMSSPPINAPSSMKSQMGEEINLIDFADDDNNEISTPPSSTTAQTGDLLNFDDFDNATE